MHGFCDLHCHILYGVDDGAQTKEEARALIDGAYASGTRTICFTPHYNPLRALASAGAEERFASFSAEMKEVYPDLTLCLGAEVLYHQKIAESLANGACRTLNGTRYVLIEFLPDDDGAYIVRSLETVTARGYAPILAHAERYADFLDHPGYAFSLAEEDIPIQLNVRSVTGENGKKVKKFCHLLLKHGAVAAIATDAHDPVLSDAKLDEGYRYVARKFGEECAHSLFCAMPRSLLGLREIERSSPDGE